MSSNLNAKEIFRGESQPWLSHNEKCGSKSGRHEVPDIVELTGKHVGKHGREKFLLLQVLVVLL